MEFCRVIEPSGIGAVLQKQTGRVDAPIPRRLMKRKPRVRIRTLLQQKLNDSSVAMKRRRRKHDRGWIEKALDIVNLADSCRPPVPSGTGRIPDTWNRK